MKIVNFGGVCGCILVSFSILGCGTDPILATTKPQNLSDRSSIGIENYKYYRVANPSAFTSCVKPLNAMCERREMEAGASLDMVQFSVSITDRGAWASESIRDYSMYLAGALSNKLGYDYFTTINVSDIGTCSSSPSAHSSGRVDGYGNYNGTTTTANNASCANLYTATHLAFKDYDPIKRGILVQYAEDRKPTLYFDLYFGIADHVEARRSGNANALQYYKHHPIDAWKYYFPSAKSVQSAVAMHGLVPNPDVMAIVKHQREGEKDKSLRKELIIRGQ